MSCCPCCPQTQPVSCCTPMATAFFSQQQRPSPQYKGPCRMLQRQGKDTHDTIAYNKPPKAPSTRLGCIQQHHRFWFCSVLLQIVGSHNGVLGITATNNSLLSLFLRLSSIHASGPALLLYRSVAFCPITGGRGVTYLQHMSACAHTSVLLRRHPKLQDEGGHGSICIHRLWAVRMTLRTCTGTKSRSCLPCCSPATRIAPHTAGLISIWAESEPVASKTPAWVPPCYSQSWCVPPAYACCCQHRPAYQYVALAGSAASTLRRVMPPSTSHAYPSRSSAQHSTAWTGATARIL